MVYALLVSNDVNPKYRSPRQGKETIDSYLGVLSQFPAKINETALVNSYEGGSFRYRGGKLQLEEGRPTPLESLTTIVFLDCEDFSEAVKLASELKMVENSLVELRPAIMLNRTTEALSEG